jgi:hypothetical protein
VPAQSAGVVGVLS